MLEFLIGVFILSALYCAFKDGAFQDLAEKKPMDNDDLEDLFPGKLFSEQGEPEYLGEATPVMMEMANQ